MRTAIIALAALSLSACASVSDRFARVEDPHIEGCALLLAVSETVKVRQLDQAQRDAARAVLRNSLEEWRALDADAPFAGLRSYMARRGVENLIAESAIQRVGSIITRGVSLNGAGELAETARIAALALEGAQELESQGLAPEEARARCDAALAASIGSL